ncbi:response regulator [Nodosilinea nodulosa]|uniref:response regulator n=1 Tax=Nodosilinea nodulosa TaxID=416001 RepID=UPI00037AC228|nr:response regulator [Nodosilinea nodulosa]
MSYKSQILPKTDLFKDVQILVVDNDTDSRDLYAFLFETYGAQVASMESIADALTHLECFIPDILICETRFCNEDILTLIQRIKTVDLDRRRVIPTPILTVSAYYSANFIYNLLAMVENHLLKPIDIDCLVDEVWNLVNPLKKPQKANIKDWVMKHITQTKQQAVAKTHSIEVPSHSDGQFA